MQSARPRAINTTVDALECPRYLRHRAASTSSLGSASPASSSKCISSPSGPSKAASVPRSPSHTAMSTSATSSTTSPRQPPAMTEETYFRLMKKSQMLDQVLQMNASIHSSEARMRQLSHEHAKTDAIQQHVFGEMDRSKKDVAQAQQAMLSTLERVTELCLREEQLQVGAPRQEAEETARKTHEQRAAVDVREARDALSRKNGHETASATEIAAIKHALDTRLNQLDGCLQTYEHQLIKSEAEISNAIHSSFAKQCEARIADLEQQLTQEVAEHTQATTRLQQLQQENKILELDLATKRELLTQLQQESQTLATALGSQSGALEHFLTDLRVELRRRYGTVPAILDTKCNQYFPLLDVKQSGCGQWTTLVTNALPLPPPSSPTSRGALPVER